jgi:phospholipid transport system substrate-binding protein
MSERPDQLTKSCLGRQPGAFLGGARLLAAVMLAFGVMAGAPAAQAAAAANPAEAFVQENADKGYGILNNAKLSESDRHMQFRAFLLGLMDAQRIGIFTLGQYANSSSELDINAFIAAFAEYTVAIYQTRLDKYKDQTLKVTGSIPRAADDVVVNGNVTDPTHPDDPPDKIAFRIRKAADGRFVITDLNVEGIWQSLTQRADFTSFLQQHGGKLQELTTNLKRQTQQSFTRSPGSSGAAFGPGFSR